MARRLAALALSTVALVGADAAAAQDAASQGQFELGRSVQQSLARIQEGWLRWVSASLQESDDRAGEALRGLAVAAREVGFQHLPDLSLAAIAQARASLAAGELERAAQQLAAAEILDPGQPEIDFARARLAAARGQWWRALGAEAGGIWTTVRGRAAAKASASLLLWLFVVLALAAGLFIALLAAQHGGEAIGALRAWLSPPLPDWAALGLLAFFALVPLALPSGLVWLFVLASIVLWSFASRSERIVLAAAWLLLAAGPPIAERLQRDQALDQSPPLRAFEAFAGKRLYGGFFTDAQVMRAALPDHPAALEFAADIHRTLGQWEVARSLYRKVVLAEPENVPALLNLGAYSFRKGDYALANAYFLRATKTAKPSAAAWFNLSLGYSDSYMFDDSRDALGQARAVDAAAVDLWMATPNPDRVLTFNGSLARRDELREALVAAWAPPMPRRLLGVPGGLFGFALAFVAAALALGFDAVRPPVAARGERRQRRDHDRLRFWLESLLPALDAARRGDGFVAGSNLLLLAALAMLPRAFEMAGDLPAPSWPGPLVLAVAAALGASIYLGVRVHAGLETRNV